MPSRDSLRTRVGHAPVFRREGDYWTIEYAAVTLRLRDAKGLRYIELLLRHPGRSFHVAELIRLATIPGERSMAAADGTADANERARKAVTNRIRQALARIADAHTALGLHLRNSVRTGTRCNYMPERQIHWSS